MNRNCLLMSRAVNFKYVTIEWTKPAAYGDAAISGYKVYVNGVVEATLSADELSFNLTSGTPCKDYIFQVQVRHGIHLEILFLFKCKQPRFKT